MSIKKGSQRGDDAGLYPQSMMPRFNVRFRRGNDAEHGRQHQPDINVPGYIIDISYVYWLFSTLSAVMQICIRRDQLYTLNTPLGKKVYL